MPKQYEVDNDLCIKCWICFNTSDIFEYDENENKVKAKPIENSEQESSAEDIAWMCPVWAINPIK
jgi:ferredoxin